MEFFSQPSRTWQQHGGSGFVSAKAGENTPSESATTVATSALQMHGNALMCETYPIQSGAQAGVWRRQSRRLCLISTCPCIIACLSTPTHHLPVGAWRSLVARFVRDEEAVGSNPAAPTTKDGL